MFKTLTFSLAFTALNFKHNLFAASALPKKSVEKEPINYPIQHTEGIGSILIVGETGTGKSTIINMMGSYFNSSPLKKPFICIPNKFYPKASSKEFSHSESNSKDQSKAQTQKANTYSFSTKEIKFNIIDTPGLNDPDGNTKDDENVEIILKAAEKAQTLSSIILVLNGTEARVTPNIQYIIEKLKGTIPDSITRNIIVVCTMCREDTCNQTDINKILGFKPHKIFYMNNTAFSSTKISEVKKVEWEESMKVCENIVETVMKMSSISTNEFSQIRKLRANIKSTLQDSRNKLTTLQQICDEFEKVQNSLKSSDNDIEKNKNYTVKKKVPKTEMVSVPYYSTICSNCNYVCHEKCGLNETRNTNDPVFMGCACMNSDGHCKECPEKCSYTSHYHDNKAFKTVMVDVDEEIEDIKKKYLAAMNQKQQDVTKMDGLTITRNALDAEIKKQQDEIRDYCMSLKKICKNFNFVDELYQLIEQLRKENIKITDMNTKKKAEDFINSIQTIAENLSKKK